MRQRLLTQFTSLPQGVKFLVDMRADALRFRKEAPDVKRRRFWRLVGFVLLGILLLPVAYFLLIGLLRSR